MKEQIITAADSPGELEALYRANPKEFTRCFPDAFAEQSESTVLRVWHERLFFQEKEVVQQASSPEWQSRDIWITVIVSLIAGTVAKLPHIFPMLDEERFFSRNLTGILAGALIAFFFLQKPNRIQVLRIIAALLIGGMIFFEYSA